MTPSPFPPVVVVPPSQKEVDAAECNLMVQGQSLSHSYHSLYVLSSGLGTNHRVGHTLEERTKKRGW